MTISVKVSVNGNYKVAVTTRYGGDGPTTEVISGRGHNGPFVKDIPYNRGPNLGDVLTIILGPEEADNG